MPVRIARASALAAGLVVTAGVLAACVPEPLGTPTAAPTGSATTTPTPHETATPEPTEPADAFVVPDSCDELYSAAMRATLDSEVAPLNDPGITMLSTQNVDAIEILEGADRSLRCTWGPPSERGIATTVAAITPEQSATLLAAFAATGFSLEDYRDGSILRIRQETITLDDELITMGETHYLRGDGWVATRWIDVDPEGYTEDIVASLWG